MFTAFPHRRIVFTLSEMFPLPVAAESLGYNDSQERVVRPEGYPYYHWLQTAKGKGVITFNDTVFELPPNSGVLLFPGVPHRYEMAADCWESVYLTFGGSAVETILSTIGLPQSALFRWQPDSPIESMVETMVSTYESASEDVFGHEISADIYRFLLLLSRYGAQDGRKQGGAERIRSLRKLITWMEQHYPNPDLGLKDISSVLSLSNRRINELFQDAFGLSPYAYFIQLRIRKAKELLVSSTSMTVRDIAEKVGFRDTSHFVATFRRHVGMPPEQFRKLH